MFDEIPERFATRIQRHNTFFRLATPSGVMLGCTLHFTIGESFIFHM